VPVPLFDPSSPRAPLRADLRAAVHRVIDGGNYVLGPEVEASETEFAAYLGAEHAIGVANSQAPDRVREGLRWRQAPLGIGNAYANERRSSALGQQPKFIQQLKRLHTKGRP
jgi:hypothetical protein